MPDGADAVVVVEGSRWPVAEDGGVGGELADRVVFGRSSECDVRIGHWPSVDAGIRRRHGSIRCLDGRTYVENWDDRFDLQLHAPEARVLAVPPRCVMSPEAHRFTVVVPGATARYRIDVACRTQRMNLPEFGTVDEADRTTTAVLPVLTDFECGTGSRSTSDRMLLTAYCEPLLRGRPQPATHAEVVGRLGITMKAARLGIERLFQRYLDAGVPMDEVDKKDALAVAAHRAGQIGSSELALLTSRYGPARRTS